MSASECLLEMKGICKAFPGVQALRDVDFELRRGEIHGIVGENGAGKSTLIKVLTGVERMDEGTIRLAGQQVTVRSPLHAQELGISTVYQEVNLCPNVTVAESVLIGREPRIERFGIDLGIDWNTMNVQAKELLLQRLGIDIDVTQPLGSYPVAVQQMAAFARALEITSAQILILDEPTSSLDANETARLFEVMHRMKSEGVAIVFITHFIDQVYGVSDRVTVLRNGELVGTFETRSLPRVELIQHMIGRTISDLDEMASMKRESAKHIRGEALLEAEGLGREGRLRPVDLEMHAGEVLGIAGLLGSGRTELAHLLYGIDKPDRGLLRFQGREVRRYSPLASINRGVALCPEDRKEAGIVEDLTVRENIILALQASRGWFKYLSPSQQQATADRYIGLLNIATPSSDQAVKNLSGGNQQKVILARALATNPQVLILDEPTRGIDVGAKAEIQRLVLKLAEEGKSCAFISSELDEVFRTSHRIAVLRDQKKVTELTGQEDVHTVMEAIAGVE
jgi:monosaccharide-transporting ATPase